tara:strand:+ start:175 stop:510 length:336 start_codon:yes stop_codon:yes gene_type:complete
LFDIGGLELLLVTIVGLLIVGPERLPEVLRSFGLWVGRLKRAFQAAKTEIEQEIGMDDIQRQLHNESVLKEIKKIESEAVTGGSEPVPETSRTESPAPPSEADLERLHQKH